MTPARGNAITSRRTFLQLLGATGATAALGGCDPSVDGLVELISAPPEADLRPPDADSIDLPSHLLNRLTWGARPGDYQRVVDLGVEAFIEEQLHPQELDDDQCERKIAHLETLFEPAAELYEQDPRQLLLDMTRAKLLRARYSRRQLYELMVDFWTDHFNIVSEKGQCKWLKAADDRDVIRIHALGNFRDLLHASAISPAMLIYLDGHANRVERPGDRPNENYARELLELHTLGVHGGYTQQDVAEVARCLSGWTYEHRPFRFRAATVSFDPARHDHGAKRVLGVEIPAGGGMEDLERVLDIVCRHASTARHIAEKLCRRFIADPAPTDAVEEVAGAFLESSGDIRATLRTLFASDAFRAQRGNRFKRPLRFVVSALRGTGADTNCAPSIVTYLEQMGHAPFQYPTPDGYPIEEQPWLGTLLWRWNFALAMTQSRINGTVAAPELVSASNDKDLADTSARLLGRRARPQELALLRQSTDPVALLLASPAFQRH